MFLRKVVTSFLFCLSNSVSETELKEIKDELKLLSAVAELKVFVNKPAKDEEDNLKQQSNSFFLDNFYSNKRELSKVLNANRKLFSKELRTKLVEKTLFYDHIFNVNYDTTLLNFYKPTDYYPFFGVDCIGNSFVTFIT